MVFVNQILASNASNGIESGARHSQATGRNGYAAHRLSDLIAGYSPVSLEETNRVALLNRQEAKYVLTRTNLFDVLSRLGRDYAVLEIDGRRLHQYRTLYFDTEDFAMYRRHHAGGLNRYKVRAREYVESGTTFLEVKHKTNRQRTLKTRYLTSQLVTDVQYGPRDFLDTASPYDPRLLVPCLWSMYTRITLVNQIADERVTVDLDVQFAWEEKFVELEGIAVAEVKYDARQAESPFMRALREKRIHRNGFSKYCMGVSLIHTHVKSNRFKAKQRLLAKLMQDARHELF